jgi:hypothetical protein
MPQFLILPIEKPDTFQAMSPQQMQGIVDKYVRWTQSLAKNKHLVSGEKLVDGEGRVVSGAGADMTVTDGPHTEAKELIGGLWIIQAKNYDEAVELCRSCPHLEYGTIVIRKIQRR